MAIHHIDPDDEEGNVGFYLSTDTADRPRRF
jgi:hypothetical protein